LGNVGIDKKLFEKIEIEDVINSENANRDVLEQRKLPGLTNNNRIKIMFNLKSK
jgi:hypothetical protein